MIVIETVDVKVFLTRRYAVRKMDIPIISVHVMLAVILSKLLPNQIPMLLGTDTKTVNVYRVVMRHYALLLFGQKIPILLTYLAQW